MHMPRAWPKSTKGIDEKQILGTIWKPSLEDDRLQAWRMGVHVLEPIKALRCSIVTADELPLSKRSPSVPEHSPTWCQQERAPTTLALPFRDMWRYAKLNSASRWGARRPLPCRHGPRSWHLIPNSPSPGCLFRVCLIVRCGVVLFLSRPLASGSALVCLLADHNQAQKSNGII